MVHGGARRNILRRNYRIQLQYSNQSRCRDGATPRQCAVVRFETKYYIMMTIPLVLPRGNYRYPQSKTPSSLLLRCSNYIYSTLTGFTQTGTCFVPHPCHHLTGGITVVSLKKWTQISGCVSFKSS